MASAVNLVYLGADSFSVRVLSQLLDIMSGLQVTTVGPEKKKVRVKRKVIDRVSHLEGFSRQQGLTFYPWDDFHQQFSSFRPPCPFEAGVVVSFGRLLPPSLLDWFPKGCLNAHPSLLPAWRGAAPLQRALISGQDRTGVSVQELSRHRFDAGRILVQESCSIDSNDTFATLSSRMADTSARLLAEVLQDMDTFRALSWEQDESRATYAPKVTASTGSVDRERASVQQCQRLHRAIGEEVGVWVDVLGRRVRLLGVEPRSCGNGGVPTSCASTEFYNREDKVLYLKFSDGWIGTRQLQVETRNPITSTDFYNAYMTERN